MAFTVNDQTKRRDRLRLLFDLDQNLAEAIELRNLALLQQRFEDKARLDRVVSGYQQLTQKIERALQRKGS